MNIRRIRQALSISYSRFCGRQVGRERQRRTTTFPGCTEITRIFRPSAIRASSSSHSTTSASLLCAYASRRL